MPPFISQERLTSYERLQKALEGANARADELQHERDTLAAENARLRSAAAVSLSLTTLRHASMRLSARAAYNLIIVAQ